MKRMKKIAALLAACLLAAAMPGLAESVSARANRDANVRRGPSKRNDIVFTLEKGEEAIVDETVTEGGEEWCHITVPGSSHGGYILKELLDFTDDETTVIASEPFEASAPAAETWRAARTKCEVNLRRSASANAVKIGELAALTDVLAGETADGWTHVRAGADEGYVQANLLDYAPEGMIAAALTAAPQAESGQTQEEAPAGKRYPDGTNLSRRIDSSYYYYLVAESGGAEQTLFSDDELAQYSLLTVGDSGDAVSALKTRLTELGYYKDYLMLGPEYSESTTEYVKRFQQKNNLPETGDADALTQALLFSDYALGASAQAQSGAPVELKSARIVSYNGASAVQVEFVNRTGEALEGFALQIIPYSAYGEAVELADTLAAQAARTYPKNAGVAKGATYSDGTRNSYFTIKEGEYFAGAMVTVASYTAGGREIQIDSGSRSWYAVGTANAADTTSSKTQGRIGSAAEETGDEWDMGFACEYVLPLYRKAYSAPEGLVVTSVEENNYGDWAGLQPGDVLLALDTTALTSTRALWQARDAIAQNATFELVFWRDGMYYAATMER